MARALPLTASRWHIHRFDTKLVALATRCVEHLAGAIDLFPMRDRAYVAKDVPLPRHPKRHPLLCGLLTRGGGDAENVGSVGQARHRQ